MFGHLQRLHVVADDSQLFGQLEDFTFILKFRQISPRRKMRSKKERDSYASPESARSYVRSKSDSNTSTFLLVSSKRLSDSSAMSCESFMAFSNWATRSTSLTLRLSSDLRTLCFDFEYFLKTLNIQAPTITYRSLSSPATVASFSFCWACVSFCSVLSMSSSRFWTFFCNSATSASI